MGKWTDANCNGVDPEIFFKKETEYEAMKVCRGCPLKRKCYEAGKDEWGVWAGETSRTRRRQEHAFEKKFLELQTRMKELLQDDEKLPNAS